MFFSKSLLISFSFAFGQSCKCIDSGHFSYPNACFRLRYIFSVINGQIGANNFNALLNVL